MNIAIVGLGLIGGSLAKAIAQYTTHTVTGIDCSPAVLQAARESGAIHKIGGRESLQQMDLTILSIYPQETIAFVQQNASLFRKGSIVTDTCGTKKNICQTLEPIAQAHGFTFIGGHPMAGKETSGFANAQADLFAGASYIFTPAPDVAPPARDLLTTLAESLRFGQTVITSPQEHDRIIAYTSQIPHALACAYVLLPECRKQKGFSAGSFRDVSRVAKINEVLWTELFLGNRENLCEELGMLIANLQKIKSAVSDADPQQIQRLLKEGRLAKEAVEP